jgi:ketopantoate reductase
LKIVILGAGVQGTVFAVRLAMVGHQVTLVSRPDRATELRQGGATIQDLKTMRIHAKVLPVLERLPLDFVADMCLVTVRREQIENVLPDLVQAIAIPRIVSLVNHANGSGNLLTALGQSRTHRRRGARTRRCFSFPGSRLSCGSSARHLRVVTAPRCFHYRDGRSAL